MSRGSVVAIVTLGCPIEYPSRKLMLYIRQILHIKDIYLNLDTLDKSYVFAVMVIGVHLKKGVSNSNPKYHNNFFILF